ncbi:MAG: family 16 glycosylhydrolase, partial [bacterium]
MKYLLRVLLLVLISVTNSLYSQAPFERCHIDLTVPPCPANPLQKPGYYVLLDQDFRNPLKYWNIHHPEDAGECKWDFIQNQNNVTFPCSSSEQMDTGYYNFDQVINPPKFNCYADLWNTNVSLNGCAYSKGEISTHTIDYNNNTFMNYYFYGSGYFEAKVKLFAAQGQGSAMWLWGVQDKDDPNITFPNILDNNEIDVFETLPNATDLFDVTYHWRQTPGMEAVEESQTIHLIPYDYTQNWTVFAVEWNENSITWFVNNELVYNIEISEQPKNCPSGNGATHYFPPIAPYCLRFNTGSNTVGDHEQTV